MDTTTTHITIPDEAWEPALADAEDPENHLIAAISINGVPLHLEAVEVVETGWKAQAQIDSFTDLEKLAVAVVADTAFRTWERNGRQYVLVATPYCV